MDTATSRSMTVVGIPRPSRDSGGSSGTSSFRGSSGTQTSSFPEYPRNPNFVIPGVPAEPKLRHSRSTRGTQTSSFPEYLRNPNFVIPRAVAESIFPCQCTNQRTKRPWHSTMDTATSRSMTVVGIPRPSRHSGGSSGTSSFPEYPRNPNFVIPGVPAEPKPRHSRSTRGTQTPSFPEYPRNPNFVIPRAVAESIFPCQCTNQRTKRPWHSTMDTATSRSMTVVGIPRSSRHSGGSSGTSSFRGSCGTQTSSFPEYPRNPNPVIPGVPAEPKLRHSARSRGIHLPLPMHQPENQAPLALHHGYCDFAQYDGRWHSAPIPSFRR